MILERAGRLGAIALAALLFVTPAFAAELPKVAETIKWETARITSPESVAEMKALQTRVKYVNQQALPSTVGILAGTGAGSGVIVSEDGLVLTAAHVIIRPRQQITFVLSDGTFVKGESLGVDAPNNLDRGMARITGSPPKNATWPGAKEGKWPVAELGKSADLKQNQWVVSMGHPGGPKQDRPPPVRTGRVGTKTEDVAKNRLLLTDCTLVGGDSGGPLFDLSGKVIGIHSQISLFSLEANMHVPIDKFRSEWERLLRGDTIGRKTEAVLGITYEDQDKVGAKISEIVESSAAAKADLAVGDVILKFNGNPVKGASDITEMLSSYDPDEKVKLLIRRDTETLSVDLKLGGVKSPSRTRRNN